MATTEKKSLGQRLRSFIMVFGGVVLFVYVVLPLITTAVPILHSMSLYLEENGIDPTRYYYTDVEQVREAELYLDAALNRR